MSFINDLLKDVDINKLIEDVPRDEVQTTINDYLESRGIDFNTIDIQNEIERIKKRKELEYERKRFEKNLTLTILLFAGSITALWLIVKYTKK